MSIYDLLKIEGEQTQPIYCDGFDKEYYESLQYSKLEDSKISQVLRMIQANEPILEIMHLFAAEYLDSHHLGVLVKNSSKFGFLVIFRSIISLIYQNSYDNYYEHINAMINVCPDEYVDLLREFIETLFFYAKCPIVPNIHLFNNISRLISNDGKLHPDPNFILTNTTLIPIVFKLFNNTDVFTYMVQFFNDLCGFSEDNSIICHKCHIDEFLIDLIEVNKFKTDDAASYLNQAIGMILKISSVQSSLEIVNKMIALFCPHEKKGGLSHLHSMFIATMSDIVSKCRTKPSVTIPCKNDGPKVIVRDIPVSKIDTGFSIGCWVYVPSDESTKSISICSIYSSKGGSIRFAIDCLDASIHINYPTTCASVDLGLKVPTDIWFFVAFGIEIDQTKTTAFGYVSSVFSSRFEAPRIDLIGSISFNFCGSEDNGNHNALVGNMWILPLNSEDQFENMFKAGPRSNDLFSSMVIVTPCIIDSANLGVRYVSNFATASLSDSKTSVYQGFLDIFIESGQLQTIIPLLSLLDKDYIDGEKVPTFAYPIIQLIGSILSSSNQAQMEFYRIKGFGQISHILCQSHKIHKNYQLYIKFYGIYDDLSHYDLKAQLMDEILLNYTLWRYSMDDSFMLITRHWGRVLYIEHWNEALASKSFSYHISASRLYNWYLPIENEIILNNDSLATYSITEMKAIRQSILQVLHKISTSVFSENDLAMLLGCCISTKDKQQSIDLLSLVKLMCVSEEEPFQKVKDSQDLFSSLHHLLNNEDIDLVFSVIDTISTLHCLEIIPSPKTHVHANILMDFIPQSVFSMDLLALLIPLSMRTHSFVPLVFYTAAKINTHKAYKLVMNHLKPDKLFGEKKTWVFWPIVSAFIGEPAFLDFVMRFIAHSSNENWDFTFSSIELISYSMKVDGNHAKFVFLNELCISLLDQPLMSFDKLHDFYDLAITFILFRKNSERLRPLDLLYQESLFNIDVPHQDLYQTPKFLEKSHFKSSMSSYNITNEYKFGIRIDENIQWSDYSLAINLIKQAKRTKSVTFHNLSVILAAFAQSFKPGENEELINYLKGSKIAEISYLTLLLRKDPNAPEFLPIKSPDCFDKIVDYGMPLVAKIDETIVNTAEKYAKFMKKCDDSITDIFNKSDENLFSRTSKMIHQFRRSEISNRLSNKHNYERTWNNVSTGNGPWRKAEGNSIIYHQISSSLCYSFSKSKITTMKKAIKNNNIIFSDDITQSRSAFVQEYRNFLTSFYEQHSPQDLSQNNQPISVNPNLPDGAPIIDIECTWIRLGRRTPCMLSLYSNSFSLSIESKNLLFFDFTNVEKIVFKPIHHIPCGIEIIRTDRKSYLLCLNNFNSLPVLSLISQLKGFQNTPIQTKLPKDYLNSLGITEKWKNGIITNFEYIMHLNEISGRTFNDISNYPIFPLLQFSDGSKRDLSVPQPLFMTPYQLGNILFRSEPFTDLHNLYNGNTFGIKNSLLTKFESSGSELSPEFFTCTASVENPDGLNIADLGAVLLPPDCKNPLEFIINNRNLLESSEISENLHKWIDLYWGINQNQLGDTIGEGFWNQSSLTDANARIDGELKMEFEGQLPVKLFDESHPKRYIEGRIVEENISLKTTLQNVSHLIEDNSSPFGLFSATAILEDGIVYRLAIVKNEQLQLRPFAKLFCYPVPNGTPRHLVDTSLGDTIAHALPGGQIVLSDSDSQAEINAHNSGVSCLAADGFFLLTCGMDSTISIWSLAHQRDLFFTTPLYRSRAITCDISSTHALATIGCIDGSISLFCISDGYLQSTIDLSPKIPEKIMITERFGHIVVYSKLNEEGYLSTYTSNGRVIHECKCEEGIAFWTKGFDSKGFDYVSYCTPSKKEVRSFNTISPHERKTIHQEEGEVGALSFSPKLQSWVSMTKDGKIFLIRQ